VWASIAHTLTECMAQWDPGNSTARYSLLVDNAGGELVLSETTGDVTVPADAVVNGSATGVPIGFNFEALPDVFTLSIRMTQVNDSSIVLQSGRRP
jgi:hypothetical protein